MAKDAGKEAWALLFKVFQREHGNFVAACATMEVSPPQFNLLKSLGPGKAVPMSEIASTLACDASNVTGLVDKLESRGLVERRPDPADRRVKMIALTERGAQFRRKLVDRVSAPPEAFGVLTARERETLRDLLRKLVDGA